MPVKLNTKPPLSRNRPTKVAIREMAKCRRVLGLPKVEQEKSVVEALETANAELLRRVANFGKPRGPNGLQTNA